MPLKRYGVHMGSRPECSESAKNFCGLNCTSTAFHWMDAAASNNGVK